MRVGSSADAIALLVELGAPPRLVRHHELVLEAADLLLERLARLRQHARFDREHVLLGVALHDAGKIRHPNEMHIPGHDHERAGRQLLLDRGVPPDIARFCVTHASWEDHEERTLEDLLVALADKLWKGKREESLEARILAVLASNSGREHWELFSELDAICEEIASDGPARLERSAV